MIKKILTFIIFLGTLSCFAKYEMILFSYDHKIIPGWSPHTFALFVELDDLTKKVIQSTHLSWLPATSPNDVEVFAKSVKGKNYSLKETLEFALKNEKKLYYKGSYIIMKELFTKAQNQERKLQSGEVEYKVLWTNREGKERTYHCVYAISDLLTGRGLMSNGMSHTLDSMENIQRHFKEYVISREEVSEEIKAHFNLGTYLKKMEMVND
ncbi:hypothetical protein A9Q84_19710 [Halobacteriovorax marinus]|uniref:Lipoprotein n=1 Tax=Halobacteriovorax marinus TaxID=97084 RepID=A0A1Y5F311_9BACT|nr:hypothetical protein A9Q84_19710 [Halobacteriovorax marinus]